MVTGAGIIWSHGNHSQEQETSGHVVAGAGDIWSHGNYSQEQEQKEREQEVMLTVDR